jgi:hypothetical protein
MENSARHSVVHALRHSDNVDMHKFRFLLIAIPLVASLFLSGCLCGRHDSFRAVNIERSTGTIWILRQGRHYGLTAEGAFPKWTESVLLTASRPIPESGKFILSVPGDAVAQYDAVASGRVQIDLDAKTATIQFTPASSHSWLRLDGCYPVTIK